jgi:hypothetical protein
MARRMAERIAAETTAASALETAPRFGERQRFVEPSGKRRLRELVGAREYNGSRAGSAGIRERIN